MKEVIIITGHPGSGKSTLGRLLAARFKLLFISKDTLKECMFDTLGARDKEWSLKVSAAAHRIMDELIKAQLSIHQGIIVESNFKPAIDSARFTKLVKDENARCIQVLCEANADMLFQRWVDRIEKGARHEGHVERISLDQIKKDLAKPYEPLAVPGTLIKFNTSNLSAVEDQLQQFDNLLK